MEQEPQNTKRLRFLKQAIGFVGATILAGCGAGGGGGSSPPARNQISVDVTINDKVRGRFASQIVQINPGDSASKAIDKAYGYKQEYPFGIIGGVKDTWQYWVDGVMPDGKNANISDYLLYNNSTILVEPFIPQL